MSRFIKAGAGYVDLNEVAGAQAIQVGGPRPRGHSHPRGTVLRILDPAGKELGIGGNIDLERETSPLVQSNATVIAVMPTGVTTAHPIAAHRVVRGVAEPIYSTAPPVGSTLFQVVGVKWTLFLRQPEPRLKVSPRGV
jgi:hypothetical protein